MRSAKALSLLPTAALLAMLASRDGWRLRWEHLDTMPDAITERARRQLSSIINRILEKGNFPGGDVECGITLASPLDTTANICIAYVVSENPPMGQLVFAHPNYPREGLSDDDFNAFIRGQGLELQ